MILPPLVFPGSVVQVYLIKGESSNKSMKVPEQNLFDKSCSIQNYYNEAIRTKVVIINVLRRKLLEQKSLEQKSLEQKSLEQKSLEQNSL